jgi:two-component system, OmpR family, alkaline phosphatase synthesis response regulator PhoP
MTEKSHILIIDDDGKLVILVTDLLEHIGYKVSTAHNGTEGLEKAQLGIPNLILLDIMMPGIDGIEVCQQLRDNPKTEHIPILMLTAKGQTQDIVEGLKAGADDYLPKPFKNAELQARINALLRRSMLPSVSTWSPFPLDDHCMMSLSCVAGQNIHVRLQGVFAANDMSTDLLHINTAVLIRDGDNLPLHEWHFNSKRVGGQLHESVFVKHPEIFGRYKQALGGVKTEELLHIRLESPGDLLRVPFECLLDGVLDASSYLVLRHPFARTIMNDDPTRLASVSPGFFNDLYDKGRELRILLIASNTYPPISDADNEIKILSKELKRIFEQKRIAVHVHVIPTKQATYTTVRNILRKCNYHVVHYAGHADYDKDLPEQSYLVFREKQNAQDDMKRLSAAEIQQLLRGSDVRFVYLSCCRGTTTGAPAKLLDGDFLGMADGIIRAGVPAVLGFRWSVSDSSAKMLALEFYKSLAEQGQLDTALLHARCEVAAHNRDDITWLSPILIMQA